MRDRGARVVFVDPLNVEPDVGEVVQLHPDTDPYLLAAMLHEIHSTVGFRLGAFEGRVEGLDEVVAFVAPYSPEAVADIVGIPAERIRELAQALAALGFGAWSYTTAWRRHVPLRRSPATVQRWAAVQPPPAGPTSPTAAGTPTAAPSEPGTGASG